MEKRRNKLLDDFDNHDPESFSWTVEAALIGLGAESYVHLFKKHNIGTNTIIELTGDDLKKIGVNDPNTRESIIKGVRSFPQYDDILQEQMDYSRKILDYTQAVNILHKSSKQIKRLYLSMMVNKLALKKDSNPSDYLVFPDEYGSSIAIKTLNKVELLVEAIESHMNKLGYKPKRRSRKLLIGTVGGMAIAALAYAFIKSLKNI